MYMDNLYAQSRFTFCTSTFFCHVIIHIRINTHELEKSIKIQAIAQFGQFIQCVIIQPIQHIFVIFSFDILTHIQLHVHDYDSYT
jgi:hypothetical protein